MQMKRSVPGGGFCCFVLLVLNWQQQLVSATLLWMTLFDCSIRRMLCSSKISELDFHVEITSVDFLSARNSSPYPSPCFSFLHRTFFTLRYLMRCNSISCKLKVLHFDALLPGGIVIGGITLKNNDSNLAVFILLHQRLLDTHTVLKDNHRPLLCWQSLSIHFQTAKKSRCDLCFF